MSDMLEWLNADYISAYDLLKEIRPDGTPAYKEVDVIIDRFETPKTVQLGKKKERMATAFFRSPKGRRLGKGLLLRPVHLKALMKIVGRETEAAEGRTVRLWIEVGVDAFGELRDCVRIKRSPRDKALAPVPRDEAPADPPEFGDEPDAGEERPRSLLMAPGDLPKREAVQATIAAELDEANDGGYRELTPEEKADIEAGVRRKEELTEGK